MTELVSDDLLALSEAHAALGQYETALDYYRRYKAARDRIFDEEKARTMAAAKMKFEADLKDQEISSLRREAEFEEFRRRILLVGAGLSVAHHRPALQPLPVPEEGPTRRSGPPTRTWPARTPNWRRPPARSWPTCPGWPPWANWRPPSPTSSTSRWPPSWPTPGPVETSSAGSGGGEPEVGEALVDIRDDAERATEIIRRLRDMMRKGEERREIHDLNTIVESAVRFVAGAAERQGLLIVRRLAPGLPPVSCDNIQLQQVVVNLLQNALTAMDGRKGDIVVRTLHADEGGVAVEVEDRGPGAPPEVLAEMFEPFFTTKRDGLGMGLAICRTILRAHGSELAVARNDDAGLSFSFRLDPA